MSSSSPDIKRCSWLASKTDIGPQSSNNPPDSSNITTAAAASAVSQPDAVHTAVENRPSLPHLHLHPSGLTLSESPYSFDLPESLISSRFTPAAAATITAPRTSMSSPRESSSLPNDLNISAVTSDSLRAEPAPLFSVDINRSSHLPSLLFPIHPVTAPSPVSPLAYPINHIDNNNNSNNNNNNNSLFHHSSFLTAQQQQQQLAKSNAATFQSPHTNHTNFPHRVNPFAHQSQHRFGHRDDLSGPNTTQPISAIQFDRVLISPRKRLSSSPDDVAQVGFPYAPLTNTTTLNLPRLINHSLPNMHRVNTIGTSFTSNPLALLPKSNTIGAGPSRAVIGGTNQGALGAGPSSQNQMTYLPPAPPIVDDEHSTHNTIGVRYKTPVEELPHVRAGIERGEHNLSRSTALKSYLEETEKRIQKTPGLVGEMWGGPSRTNINVSVRYPRGEDDVDVLLDEATVLHSAWFTRLRQSLTIQLEEIKQSAMQTEEMMERRLDAQRRFRSIPIEEVNKRMEYCRAKFLKCRLAVLEKYKTFVRALKWVHLSPRRVRRGSLTQIQNNVLRLWLFRHFADPYPTAAEKQRLMQECEMDDTQIGNWFINSRVRIWKPCLNAVSQRQAACETVRQLEEKRAERRAQQRVDEMRSKRRRVDDRQIGESGGGGGSGGTSAGNRPW